MATSGANLFPFYVFSGAAYLGLLWFLVDVILARSGLAYRQRLALGPKLNSDIAHERAAAAAASGDFEEAYRLERVSRDIERERADTDQFGLSVGKSYPKGLRFVGEYISHFWWRVFGTYLMVVVASIALMGINLLGWLAAPITRLALRIFS